MNRPAFLTGYGAERAPVLIVGEGKLAYRVEAAADFHCPALIAEVMQRTRQRLSVFRIDAEGYVLAGSRFWVRREHVTEAGE